MVLIKNYGMNRIGLEAGKFKCPDNTAGAGKLATEVNEIAKSIK